MKSQYEKPWSLPLRSVAVALIFCIICGPVGLLYASLFGGIFLIILSLFVIKAKLFVLLAMIWLISCIWAVAAVQRYNHNLIRH